jgi:hypothetical protein
VGHGVILPQRRGRWTAGTPQGRGGEARFALGEGARSWRRVLYRHGGAEATSSGSRSRGRHSASYSG